jgi:hypothetical protein
VTRRIWRPREKDQETSAASVQAQLYRPQGDPGWNPLCSAPFWEAAAPGLSEGRNRDEFPEISIPGATSLEQLVFSEAF